jgi:hypothetical protein
MERELAVPVEDRSDEVLYDKAFVEVAFNPGYDITHWLECAAHFFYVRLFREEHDMLWTANECLDLRRFAQMPDEQQEQDYEDIYEPLSRKDLELDEENGCKGRPSLRGGVQ